MNSFDIDEFLKQENNYKNFKKIEKIKNFNVRDFIIKAIQLCKPGEIFVSDGSDNDIEYIRRAAILNNEEIKLKTEGHTAHFDNIKDQGRAVEDTKFLIPKGVKFDPNLNKIDKEEGLKEIMGLLDGIMKNKCMYILFYSLGPVFSEFAIPCIQITDSAYVAHNENLLYRQGYEMFLKLPENSDRFLKFLHSAGELENYVSKNIDKRRIYIDLDDKIVYSVNTQYGGNSIGLKKLAMRHCIKMAYEEGWLTEHMFIVGVFGPNNRKSYFTGAFPSLCGKTSTSTLPTEKIVGDDIAFLKERNGRLFAVNVEKGIFGIIDGINKKDDPIIAEVLEKPCEIIFSNILITEDKTPYWNGKDGEVPERGINYSGEWYKGKKDENGKEIPASHKNARFTIALESLPNVDENLNNPEGVPIAGIIYGGRDSDTSVPVEEAFDWIHGIVTKAASLESETTAATLGQVGIRKINPMSNLDFLSIPIGKYIEHNINFGKKLKYPVKIFGVNYFLKDKDGKFLNDKKDKIVWIKWMELRCHNECGAVKLPTGLIPLYKDLEKLFKEKLNKEYSKEDYVKQFTLRVFENLSKIERVIKFYREKVEDAPEILFKVLLEQKERLEKAQSLFGNYISPFKFEEVF